MANQRLSVHQEAGFESQFFTCRFTVRFYHSSMEFLGDTKFKHILLFLFLGVIFVHSCRKKNTLQAAVLTHYTTLLPNIHHKYENVSIWLEY